MRPRCCRIEMETLEFSEIERDFASFISEAERLYGQGEFDKAFVEATRALSVATSVSESFMSRLLVICCNFRKFRFDDVCVLIGDLGPRALGKNKILSHETNGRVAVMICVAILGATHQYSRDLILKHMCNISESACGNFFDAEITQLRHVAQAISQCSYGEAIKAFRSVSITGFEYFSTPADNLEKNLIVEFTSSFLRIRIEDIQDEFGLNSEKWRSILEGAISNDPKLTSYRIDLKNEQVHRVGWTEEEKIASAQKRRIDTSEAIMTEIVLFNFRLVTASNQLTVESDVS